MKDAFAKDQVGELPTNDLRKTKAAFVEQAVAAMNQSTDGSEMLSKGAKYKLAVSKWMESATRAVLMSGKAPGFALIATD